MITNNVKKLLKIIERYKEGQVFLIDTIKKQEKFIDKQQNFIKDVENDLLKLKDIVIKLQELK